jgi:dolichyl-phosphate beta-glucosyltransferase
MLSPALSAPLASIVIPAYREGSRLPRLLASLVDEALATQSPPAEIVVVDDGSGRADAERERAAALESGERLAAASPHRVRFVASLKNRGKGGAIRLGWSEADAGAAWLGFLDADGAVSAPEAWRLVRMLERSDDFDALAGARIFMAGRDIERSFLRHVQGRIFATIAEHAFRFGFYDTQCGVKLFRAALLRPLLPQLHEDRWLLDIEALALMKRAGARLREEPIDWFDPGGSKVVPGVDALRMALGLWRIRRRLNSD